MKKCCSDQCFPKKSRVISALMIYVCEKIYGCDHQILVRINAFWKLCDRVEKNAVHECLSSCFGNSMLISGMTNTRKTNNFPGSMLFQRIAESSALLREFYVAVNVCLCRVVLEINFWYDKHSKFLKIFILRLFAGSWQHSHDACCVPAISKNNAVHECLSSGFGN